VGAIDLLRQQHRDVEDLFEQLRTAERRQKIGLLGKLAEDLTVHATLEEKYFYPAAQKNPDLAARVAQARAEHDQVRRMISEILELKSRDPQIDSLVAQLEATVKKHVEEEEREFFPRMEADATVLAMMGEQMQREQGELRRQELLTDQEQLPQA